MKKLVWDLTPRLLFTGHESIGTTQLLESKEVSGEWCSKPLTMTFHAC